MLLNTSLPPPQACRTYKKEVSGTELRAGFKGLEFLSPAPVGEALTDAAVIQMCKHS